MQSTYTDAFSAQAETRLKSQYGFGAKRYGAVASWKTILKAFYYDLRGNTIPESLYKANHPAQLHYGMWESTTRTFDEAICNASLRAFSKLSFHGKMPSKIIHFGSGFGGVEMLLCRTFPDLKAHGITIDPIQFETAKKLGELFHLSKKVHYLKGNFLKPESFGGERYEGGMGIESICHVPEAQLGMLWRTMGMVLKPGARFVIHDWYRKKQINKTEANKIEIFLRGWDMPSCPPVQSMMAAAKHNRFRVIENVDVTAAILPSARKIYERALFFKPIVQLFQKSKNTYIQTMGIHTSEAIAFANACIVQRELFEKKIISYRQLVFEKK